MARNCTYEITINGEKKVFNSEMELDTFLDNYAQNMVVDNVDATLQVDQQQVTVDKISEAGRLTTQKSILDEDQRQVLNRVLNNLLINKKEHLSIMIDYFVEDEYKEGGSYATVRGQFKDIDEINKRVILLDKTTILIDDIYHISILKD